MKNKELTFFREFFRSEEVLETVFIYNMSEDHHKTCRTGQTLTKSEALAN